MARPRRSKVRSRRRRPWVVLLLAAVAAAGCKSQPSPVSQQNSASPPVAAAPSQHDIQLAECHGANSNDSASCQQAAYQVPTECLPAAPRLEDPNELAFTPTNATPVAEPERLPLPGADRPDAMTLEETIALALAQNPRLSQAMARLGGASAEADVAYAPFLPQIGTGFRYSDFSAPVLPGGSFVPASLNSGVKDFLVAEAGVQWTLYDFGRTQGRYSQAVERERIQALALSRAKQTIAFETAQAYFRLLAAKANLKVRDEALQRATSVLEDTNSRFTNGDADRVDVLRAEVEVAQIQEEIFSARQAIRDAESTLNVVLGRSAAEPVEIAPIDAKPKFEDSIESCLETAAGSRREISMAQRAVAEARYGLEAARGELLPKIYMRGAVIRGDSTGPLNAWIEGIGLHIDQSLYKGGALRGEVRQSEFEIHESCAALQSILDQVTLQVRVSYEAIGTDMARIRLGETTIGRAEENMRLTTVKYNNGDATPTDMVDAQTALIRAQTAYTTAVYSYLTDLAQLQYAMGNDQSWLLGQLNLQESG